MTLPSGPDQDLSHKLIVSTQGLGLIARPHRGLPAQVHNRNRWFASEAKASTSQSAVVSLILVVVDLRVKIEAASAQKGDSAVNPRNRIDLTADGIADRVRHQKG